MARKRKRSPLHPPQTPRAGGRDAAGRGRLLAAACLSALALLIVAERIHTADEPLERDICSHAVIAHEMLAGRSLYSDLWDLKPPGNWLAYAAAETIFGYGPREVLWLGVSAAVLTLLGVFWTVRHVAAPAAGVAAAAVWAAACGDLMLWANQPNSEAFMNAALVWAFALLIGARDEGRDWQRFVGIGALSFAASLCKTVVPAVVAAWCVAHVLAPPGGRARRTVAIAQTAIVAATAAAGWLAVLGYFALTGRGGLFAEMLFPTGLAYTSSRGGSILTNALAAFGPRGLANAALSGVWPIAVLFVAAATLGLIFGPRRPWALVAAYAVGAQVAVGLPGRFYHHYFQLLLPAFAVAAGLAWGSVADGGRRSLTSALRVAAVAALLLVAGKQLSDYALPADEWSVRKYGSQFLLARHLGERLAARLRPDEDVYVWGPDPEIYFYARKSPPSGVIWADDTISGPVGPALMRRTLEALERRTPAVLVINRKDIHPPPGDALLEWLNRTYVSVAGFSPRDMFAVMGRAGTDSASRLAWITAGLENPN
ncbi:MAG TPA: hypothetical protein VMT19_02990 [Thermoanaerobaculaceae bacterium]|nr:hypothetical protein [Thermoanaerobaculaceae bacterium]